MNTLTITFSAGQVLTATQMNAIVEKINEIINDNTGGGATITVVDNLTSTSTTDALSANQGKVLNTSISGKYTKPSGGIPKTDLVSGVQTSLTKADSALQPTGIATTKPSTGFLANTLYQLGQVTGSVTWNLNTDDVMAMKYNEYMIEFETGATPPTITWFSGVTWLGGSTPTINANKKYFVSIVDNLAVIGEF